MANHLTTYIVDACALIAFFRNEDGSDTFSKLLKDKSNHFYMHAVNVGEVYYDSLRVSDEVIADEILQDIVNLPIDVIWTLDIPFIKLIGKYKTSFRISYADTFVLALAEREGGIVVTTDHHEFDEVEKEGQIQFCWLR